MLLRFIVPLLISYYLFGGLLRLFPHDLTKPKAKMKKSSNPSPIFEKSISTAILLNPSAYPYADL